MTEVERLSPAKRALLERALRQRRQTAGVSAAIPRRSGDGPAPLSFAQQRMWFLQQWEPGSPTFNGARAFRLRGQLDKAALERAFRTVLERHESLRTVVGGERDPVQLVLEKWSFELPTIQLQDAGDDALRPLLRDLAREPFDLAKDLMLRATVLDLGPAEHVLLVRMHHIAADAHSDRVLFSEISELYDAAVAGRVPQLPALPIQYGDFAVWQRDRLRGHTLEELTSYWARQLEGAPALLRLPTDRPRAAIQRHVGAHRELLLDRQLADQLVALGRNQSATFFMTMLAAFSTLLYRLTGEEDIVLGSPIANRNNVELAGLIGFFTNTLALRTRLGGNPSFREVVSRARETALGAYAHQDLPFEKVVEAVQPKRDPSYNPLFVVNFRAQESERAALALRGLEAEPLKIDIGFSRFDLALELELRSQELYGYFEFDQDLFDAESVAGFDDDLRALLEQVAAHPDVPVLAIQLPRGPRAATRAGTGQIRRRVAR